MRTYRIQGPDGQFSLAVTEEAVVAYAQQGHIGPQTLLQDCATGEQFYAGQHPLVAGAFHRPAAPPRPPGATRPASPGKVVAIVLACLVFLAAIIVIPTLMIQNTIKSVTKQVTQPKVCASKDGQSRITLPWQWTQNPEPDNQEAVLEANATFEDSSLVIITEARKDFDADFGLERYSAVTRKLVLKKLEAPSTAGPKRLTLHGYPALQYELRGEMAGAKSVTLHTCVETPRNFHQIILATTPSRFTEARKELDDIVASFEEIPQ